MWFNCVCGYTFHDNTDRLPFKGHVISDENFEELWESYDRYAAAPAPKSPFDYSPERERIKDSVFDKLRTVYQCPECGTVYFDDFKSNRLYSFIPRRAVPEDNPVWEDLKKAAGEDEGDIEKNLLRSRRNFEKE